MSESKFQIGSGKGPYVKTGPIAALRAKRIELRLSIHALAPRIGITHASISRWERGLWTPNLPNFLAWAEELKMELPEWMR